VNAASYIAGQISTAVAWTVDTVSTAVNWTKDTIATGTAYANSIVSGVQDVASSVSSSTSPDSVAYRDYAGLTSSAPTGSLAQDTSTTTTLLAS
jgi:phage-related protein